MKKEKLFYQFYKAIEACVDLGVDKHSYKRSGCDKVKIFSFEDRRNILKGTNQLCDFIEENYPEVMLIKNIKCEHIQSFFIEKANYCTLSTLRNYMYCIKKLEKMIKQELHLQVNYTNGVKLPNVSNIALRIIEMDDNDLQIILEECNKSKSATVNGIRLAILFGLRVSEVCKFKGKDINLDEGFIHIHESKGKRCRNIKIETEEQLKLCKVIKETVSYEERVCPVREDTVNLTMKRMLIKHKITRYQVRKTGIHAVRKSYATKDFKENLEKYNNEKEAWKSTVVKLGHNEGRKDLKNIYVKN